jgi:hypothetical protein
MDLADADDTLRAHMIEEVARLPRENGVNSAKKSRARRRRKPAGSAASEQS